MISTIIIIVIIKYSCYYIQEAGSCKMHIVIYIDKKDNKMCFVLLPP